MTTVKCKHCQGSGVLPLPHHLEETLDLVKQGANTSAQVADRFAGDGCVHLAAICNRLTDLWTLGVLTREKRTQPSGGNEWVYSLAEVGE